MDAGAAEEHAEEAAEVAFHMTSAGDHMIWEAQLEGTLTGETKAVADAARVAEVLVGGAQVAEVLVDGAQVAEARAREAVDAATCL